MRSVKPSCGTFFLQILLIVRGGTAAPNCVVVALVWFLVCFICGSSLKAEQIYVCHGGVKFDCNGYIAMDYANDCTGWALWGHLHGATAAAGANILACASQAMRLCVSTVRCGAVQLLCVHGVSLMSLDHLCQRYGVGQVALSAVENTEMRTQEFGPV